MYMQILIWEKKDRLTAIRYLCFQNLTTLKYCVQSADFYRSPIDDVQIKNFDEQSIELFIESEPLERCTWHDRLIDAIDSHKKDFS